MSQVLSTRAAERLARRVHVEPWLLALMALALVMALEAAAFAYAAPMLDPTAPIYVS